MNKRNNSRVGYTNDIEAKSAIVYIDPGETKPEVGDYIHVVCDQFGADNEIERIVIGTRIARTVVPTEVGITPNTKRAAWRVELSPLFTLVTEEEKRNDE